ncbi:MAG: deoxyribose-phosphate aldolase [Chloroflexota bacterium]
MHAETLTRQELAKHIQFTNVRPEATYAEVVAHLETTVQHGFHAAMISMCWVPLARQMLQGTGVVTATCIGLGTGHESLHAKIAQIRECRALGAEEVDYAPNMGFLLSGMLAEFQEEGAGIVRAAEGMPVKAMLELGYVKDEALRRKAVQLLDEAGVPWIKNSSGWGPGSEAASPENIGMIRKTVTRAHVKASGKINSYEKAVALLNAGAELLGTSSAVAILDNLSGDTAGY